MTQYTFFQWLLFFYFYCFAGWCFESTYVSLKTRKLTNRGFMRGPFLPIYGSGAIIMLFASIPFKENLVLTYFAGAIAATLLEYVTGVSMEAIFKVRYWDYSNQKFNFQGHICLSSTIAWGFLTLLLTNVLHTPVESFVLGIPEKVTEGVAFVLTIFIAADFALSFKAALDLRDILVRMEKIKEDVTIMQKRLDVIVAVAGNELENRKEELEERLDSLREKIKVSPSEYLDSVKEEINEIAMRYRIQKEKREHLLTFRDFYKRNMILNNPLSSKRFKDALEEIKRKVK